MDIFCYLSLNHQGMTWATYQAYTVDLSDHMVSTNMLPEQKPIHTSGQVYSTDFSKYRPDSCYRRFIFLKLKDKANPATEMTTKN